MMDPWLYHCAKSGLLSGGFQYRLGLQEGRGEEFNALSQAMSLSSKWLPPLD